jgi:hypothetical protein
MYEASNHRSRLMEESTQDRSYDVLLGADFEVDGSNNRAIIIRDALLEEHVTPRALMHALRWGDLPVVRAAYMVHYCASIELFHLFEGQMPHDLVVWARAGGERQWMRDLIIAAVASGF